MKILIALVLVVAGCGDSDVIRVGASEGVVFSADKGAQLLEPCSRERPAKPDGYWLPAVADIQSFEAALPDFLKSHPPPRGAGALDDVASYKRQYVGVLRGNRRSIYANFLIYHLTGMDDWATDPVVVCDGGAKFFGAEFDVALRQFVHVAYNGVG